MPGAVSLVGEGSSRSEEDLQLQVAHLAIAHP